MKKLLTLIFFIPLTSHGAEFCGLLNSVTVSAKSKTAKVTLYNKKFSDAFISIANYDLADTVLTRIENEIDSRNKNLSNYKHPDLKNLKIKRLPGGKISFANWYYKASKVKYSFCVNLSSNVIRRAKKVYAFKKPTETDYPLINKMKVSINKSVFTPAESLSVWKNGENIEADDFYDDPWFDQTNYSEYCYKGNAKDLKNYLNQNDGMPFWYWDEGYSFVDSTVNGDQVIVEMFNSYDYSNEGGDSEEDREDFTIYADVLKCD